MAFFEIGGSVSANRQLKSGCGFSDRRVITRILEVDEGILSLDRNLKGRQSGGANARNAKASSSCVLYRNGDTYEPLSLQFHSEYTSTFKWHEFGGYGHLDAVKQQPMSSNGKIIYFFLVIFIQLLFISLIRLGQDSVRINDEKQKIILVMILK